MRLFLASASGSPTICHTVFCSVSSSTTRDGRAELDGLAGQLRDVDHLGARELVLELGDAALVVRLLFLGGVILRVLRQVAMGARVGDLLDDPRAFHRLALLELVFEGRYPSAVIGILSIVSLPPTRRAPSGIWLAHRANFFPDATKPTRPNRQRRQKFATAGRNRTTNPSPLVPPAACRSHRQAWPKYVCSARTSRSPPR